MVSIKYNNTDRKTWVSSPLISGDAPDKDASKVLENIDKPIRGVGVNEDPQASVVLSSIRKNALIDDQ
eukprot:scaffold1117_cov167-Amphora_coffeaeformis.AAC.3